LLLTQWGSVGTGDGQFENSTALTVDAQENVYVADVSRVEKFGPEGQFLSPIYA
jgi:hypothetical protein